MRNGHGHHCLLYLYWDCFGTFSPAASGMMLLVKTINAVHPQKKELRFPFSGVKSEIKSFNPSAKTIIMLRNPVDYLHHCCG
jgi:hypothetical protein